MTMTDNGVRIPLHFACSDGNISMVSLILGKCPDPEVLMNVSDKDGRTPIQVAAYFGRIEVIRLLISMNPSSERQQEALSAVGTNSDDSHAYESSFTRNRAAIYTGISSLPVVEWQRQLGLQDEYLYVERTVLILDQQQYQQQQQATTTNSESLCVLVLREEVLRRPQFLYRVSQQHDRAILPDSLQWHQRNWHEKFPL